MEVVHTIAEAMPSVDDSKVLGELADFRSKENIFAKTFVWKSVQQTTPTSWWNGICSSTQLSRVAANILNLPPTSAAVERSFSRHSWIHSGKRNRLTTERASQIVYIAHNISLNDTAHGGHDYEVHEILDSKKMDNQPDEPEQARAARPSSSKYGQDEEEADNVFNSDPESSDSDLEISLHDSSDAEFSEVELQDIE